MSNEKEPQVKAENPTKADAGSEYAEQIKSWTTYAHYLGIFGGAVKTAKNIIIKEVSDAEIKKEVEGALHAVYVAVQGVYKELIDGINSMAKGEAPKHEFPPTDIPDWNSEGDTDNIFESIWQTFKPGFEKWLDRVTGDTTFEAVIVGLINAGDSCADILEKAF